MRIALVGVGLIGGSVGLAARERLGAEVVGYDPAPAALEAALEVGAVDVAAATADAALEGAEAAFVAAPVGALPEAVVAALAAAGEDCVVTDVGSTKRTVVEATADARFIGGHPLAGAASAGVRNARAGLFDGATWYLTPTATTRGTLYERLHRLLSGLGARPVALDAETHDRMLATVSHLPHVLANVLVAQAARTRSEEDEPLPATGPSFRDITRVAGSNTAIWRDIYLANADALIDSIDDTVARLGDVPRRARRRRRGGHRSLERRRPRRPPAAARGRPRRGRGVRAAGLRAQPAGGGRRRRAGARARGDQHRRHGAAPDPGPVVGLDRAVDRRRGAREAGRAADGGARAAGDARMNARFGPGPAVRGTLAPPPDKSISHRAALLGAMSAAPVRVTNYLASADTHSSLDAVRALGARVEEDDGALVIHGPGLRGAADGAAIDVGNAGTLLRLLPGWLAGQDGGRWTLDGDASIRRRPVDRVARPLAAMGARLDAREERFTPLVISGRPLRGIEYALPVASAQIKSCVLLAGLLAEGATTVVEPEPSRDHTERLLTAAGAGLARDGDRITVTPPEAFALEAIHVPGDPSSAAFHVAAAALVPGSRLTVTGMAANWTRVGFFRILERMGAALTGELETRATAAPDAEPLTTLEIAHGPLTATRVTADEVPLAIDELPLVALLGCFAEGETVVEGAQELRLKESDRIATVVDGLRGLGADIEATDDGFAVRGTGGLQGGTIAAHGDHRLAMLGAVAGLASRSGVEVVGMEAAAVSYPGFAADLAALTG